MVFVLYDLYFYNRKNVLIFIIHIHTSQEANDDDNNNNKRACSYTTNQHYVCITILWYCIFLRFIAFLLFIKIHTLKVSDAFDIQCKTGYIVKNAFCGLIKKTNMM